MSSPPFQPEIPTAAPPVAVDPQSPAARQEHLPSAFQVWGGISLGVALKFAGVGQMFGDRAVEFFALYWISNQAVIALLGGIGGALAFRAIRARQAAWMQPGHWIAVETLGLLIASLIALPFAYLNQLFFAEYFLAIIVEQLLTSAIGAAWYGLIVRQSREGRAWETFAYASLVIYVISGIAAVCTILNGMFESVGIVVLLLLSRLLLIVVRAVAAIVATIQDVRSGNGRDTLHWVCLAITVSGVVISMLLYLALMFFRGY